MLAGLSRAACVDRTVAHEPWSLLFIENLYRKRRALPSEDYAIFEPAASRVRRTKAGSLVARISACARQERETGDFSI
jgi:hypothetical protein